MRVRTFGVLLFILVFALLPLYELADIGEQWPHDGDVVQVVLFALFIVGLSMLCRGIAGACFASLRRRPLVSLRGMHPHACRIVVAPRDCAPLFLMFCDFRV